MYRTPAYSRSGWTAIATLAGSVQGVVVQIIDVPRDRLRPSLSGTPETTGKFT